MSQKTIYRGKDAFRIVTDDEDDSLWIADDLDQNEVNLSRDELRAMLPTLTAWANGKVN